MHQNRIKKASHVHHFKSSVHVHHFNSSVGIKDSIFPDLRCVFQRVAGEALEHMIHILRFFYLNFVIYYAEFENYPPSLHLFSLAAHSHLVLRQRQIIRNNTKLYLVKEILGFRYSGVSSKYEGGVTGNRAK